jgi:hypothetical protein
MAKGRSQATAALVAFMALGLAGRASGNDEIAPTEQPKPTIVLHVANYAALPPNVLDIAKARVAGVYKVIGVRTVWDNGGEAVSRLENGELHLNVLLLPRDMRPTKNSAGEARADLLGAAHLPSGRAYIFYDRIAAMPGPPTSLTLGDVIAHEVGHLVLRAGRHSPSGIMRASLAGSTILLQSFNGQETRAIRASLMAAK